MDVLFLIDESGSVGPSNFAKNLAFAADFINELDLADDKTKVGFAKFDGSYTQVFDFSSDHSSVIMDLQSSNFNAGGTDIGGAIQSVADDFQSGDFAWRPATESWVVVMTDGQDRTSLVSPPVLPPSPAAKVPVNQMSTSSLSVSVQASTVPKSTPSPLNQTAQLPSLATTNLALSKKAWVPKCASKADSILSVLHETS